MKTTKEKADELIFEFYNIKSDEYNYGINYNMAKQCAILSVKHTIEVLQKEDDVSGRTLGFVIEEQNELLKELESRL